MVDRSHGGRGKIGIDAEVSGKIVDIHPRLKKGAILPKGAVLLRIDSTDYLLTIAQSMATAQTACSPWLRLS